MILISNRICQYLNLINFEYLIKVQDSIVFETSKISNRFKDVKEFTDFLSDMFNCIIILENSNLNFTYIRIVNEYYKNF